MLPHKKYQEQDFLGRTNEFSARFSSLSQNSIFPKVREEVVPLDGFPMFVSETWETIRNQRDLNLPNQREVVARFRCSEIKQEALEKIQYLLDMLVLESTNNPTPNFKNRCSEIIQEASTFFVTNASVYTNHQKFLKELQAQIFNQLYNGFEFQIQHIVLGIQNEFELLLKKMSKPGVINDTFHKKTSAAFASCLQEYERRSQEIQVDGPGWLHQIATTEKQLSDTLTNLLKQSRHIEIDKMKHLTVKETKLTIEGILDGPITRIQNTFWQQIRGPYQQEMSALMQACQQILQKGFNSSQIEILEFMESFETEIKNHTVSHLKAHFSNINQNLQNRFRQEFMHNKNGSQRNWVVYKKDKIRDLWV